MTVAELGERALLARVLARLPKPTSNVLVGPGDDAAVLASTRNQRLVVTTDAIVEGVHVSRAFSTPSAIGHKALAVNLSDLAAMGAQPRWAVVSLILPGSWLIADVEDLMDGCARLARIHGVSIVGGNLARTDGPLVVDITAGGEVHARRWLTRDGARPGDEVYVSGTIGAAAAGLEMLKTGTDTHSAICVERQRQPIPRVRLGSAMARAKAARAAMDLSDGLADALTQVAEASKCGVRIDAASLPIEPDARAFWTARGIDPIHAALVGGEDYELLFAVPKRGGRLLRAVHARVAEPSLTRIGVFTKDATECALDRDGRVEALPRGYEHYR